MKVQLYPSGALGTNCYLGIDEATKQAFIVDPGGVNDNLTADINRQNLEVQYIILTHGHGDHICGVETYQKLFPKARLVAAEAEKSLLADSRTNASIQICGRPISLTVDLAVEDGDVLQVGQTELQFLMTPGHTPGGMCIYAKGTLFSGDTLFAQSIGRTDLPGGSFPTLKRSIETKLYVLPPETVVLPGHMGPTTIRAEKESNPFV